MQKIIAKTDKIITFDYLRSFIILLTLIHHSIVAYTPLSKLSQVTDKYQWLGFKFIVLFNYNFSMSLLFLISGFFVWQSLKRKGAKKFLYSRFIKLGIPYLLLTSIAASFGMIGIAGHLWFLWVLLTFDILSAILYKLVPHLDDKLKIKASGIFKNHLIFFAILFIISIFIYLPIIIKFGPQWILILHLIYFFAGLGVGAYGIENTIFNSQSKLTKNWWLYLSLAIVTFIIGYNLFNFLGTMMIVTNILFSALMTLGVSATFLRFVTKHTDKLDNLNTNAYGIYIVHYIFVTGLQYYLLEFNLHAIYKSLIVFIISFLLSWIFISTIRRLSLIRKVI
ncbi:MAG: acyltransferase [Patescibacteria group bacterium]